MSRRGRILIRVNFKRNFKSQKVESIWIKSWLFLFICLSVCLFLLSIGWVSWLGPLFSRSWAWCRGSAPLSRLASFLQRSPRPWPPSSALPKCSRWCRACVSPYCCCHWPWIKLKYSFSPAIIFHHLLKHFNVCIWLKGYVCPIVKIDSNNIKNEGPRC